MLNAPNLSQLKLKIADTVLDMPVPKHLHEEPKRKKWYERLDTARTKFEINYTKIESGWVLKKEHEIESDPKVVEEKHR